MAEINEIRMIKYIDSLTPPHTHTYIGTYSTIFSNFEIFHNEILNF